MCYQGLNPNLLTSKFCIDSLVLLLDQQDVEKEVIVVTASSPLGRAINQAEVGDEICVNIEEN